MDSSQVVGEKRPFEPPTETQSEQPQEKKQKLDDTNTTSAVDNSNSDVTMTENEISSTSNEQQNETVNGTNQTESNTSTTQVDQKNLETESKSTQQAPTNTSNTEGNQQTQNLENSSAVVSGTNTNENSLTEKTNEITTEGENTSNNNTNTPNANQGMSFPVNDTNSAQIVQNNNSIPFPEGYNPAIQGNFINSPLAPSPTRPTRRSKAELLQDAFEDPESKWSHAATEKMLSLYADFGKRKVLDEKLHDELMTCLEFRGNPAVTLMSADGMSFFTFLTVASECGDFELVKKFLTDYKEEFTPYDFEVSLQAALRNKNQDIGEYLLMNTDVIPDHETVMEMFDIQMNDEIERKVSPLRAFITRCIDTNKYATDKFFVPEILNRAIYANNVAALEVLFETKKDEFLPLLEQATPESKVIRAGRGKSQDIGEGVPPLAYAAVMERAGCLEVFLKAGANPNFICNEMGGTLLHIVGHKGNTEMIELLIEYEADPRITNERGVVALTRTKGRKARKCIVDTVERLNQRDGISTTEIPLPVNSSHPGPHNDSNQINTNNNNNPMDQFRRNLGPPMNLPHHHSQFVGNLPDSIVLSEGPIGNFNNIMTADHRHHPLPSDLQQQMNHPPHPQMNHPPPFAQQRVNPMAHQIQHSFPADLNNNNSAIPIFNNNATPTTNNDTTIDSSATNSLDNEKLPPINHNLNHAETTESNNDQTLAPGAPDSIENHLQSVEPHQQSNTEQQTESSTT